MNPLAIHREDLLDDILQEFYGDVALWAKLDHPNILRCFGVTVDRPQVLMKWMPNGEAMAYMQECKHVECVSLVSSFTFIDREVNINCGLQHSLLTSLAVWIIFTHMV